MTSIFDDSEEIFSTYEIFTLNSKYITTYVYSYINSPVSGTTLSKNTEYDLSVTFSNGYAYSIVDVPVVAYVNIWNKTQYATTSKISLDNDYGNISGINNYKIDLKYYLPEKPGDSKVTKTFKFATKNTSYTDPEAIPGYGVVVGYILDQNYIPKSGPYYLVN